VLKSLQRLSLWTWTYSPRASQPGVTGVKRWNLHSRTDTSPTLGFLGSLVDWDAFWYHASRWIGSLSLRGANRRGNLVPTWDPKYGLGITALQVLPWDWKRQTQSERPITSVWGEHSSLPSSFSQIIHRIDNQTSRLLMLGNTTRQV
jgi:hypothetical protein